MRARAREYVAKGTDGFKVVIEDGLGGSGTYKVIGDDMLRAIAEEAEQARLPIYVHAINLEEFRRALVLRPRAIVHALEDPLPPGDALPAEMVRQNIYLVPTLSLFEAFTSFDGHPERFDDPVLQGSVPRFLLDRMRRPEYIAVEKQRFQEVARMDVYPWARKAVPIFRSNVKKMKDEGVRIAVGTDAGGPVGYNFQGYNTPREIELLVEVGFSPMEAIVAATRTGAEVIGVEKELGTLEAGKRADLVVLDADPLADIRNVRRISLVVQAGLVHRRDAFAAR